MPFTPVVGLNIELVDSAAGSRKTLTAIKVAMEGARNAGRRFLFAQPTLALIEESVEFAERINRVWNSRRGATVPVRRITSMHEDPHEVTSGKDDTPTAMRLLKHLKSPPSGGELVFATHATFLSVLQALRSERVPFECIIDEELAVILTRAPFDLHDNYRVLTRWMVWSKIGPSPAATRALARVIAEQREELKRRAADSTLGNPALRNSTRDIRVLASLRRVVDPKSNATKSERANALARIDEIEAAQAKEKEWMATSGWKPSSPVVAEPEYYHLLAHPALKPRHILRKVSMAARDEVYRIVRDVARWIVEGVQCFTRIDKWDLLQAPIGVQAHDRGRVTIAGFRRPDGLQAFERVTFMSALACNTMMYQVWSELGVNWHPSSEIPLSATKLPLGKRRLKIYWLTAQGWTKWLRNRSGGIRAIFDLVKKSGAVGADDEICVQVNKDTATADNPGVVLEFFPRAVVLPHAVHGQNRFRSRHTLIHLAALNASGSDIRWIETQLGIDSHRQRLARTGQQVYQALCRLSIRNPRGTEDITLVVMDRDVAEWLVQWFEPEGNVEVSEIDSTAVIRRKQKPGRKPTHGKAMSGAERMRVYRARKSGGSPE